MFLCVVHRNTFAIFHLHRCHCQDTLQHVIISSRISPKMTNSFNLFLFVKKYLKQEYPPHYWIKPKVWSLQPVTFLVHCSKFSVMIIQYHYTRNTGEWNFLLTYFFTFPLVEFSMNLRQSVYLKQFFLFPLGVRISGVRY